MTKEKFVEKWRDEMTGYMLASFIQAGRNDASATGLFMRNQMHKTIELLEKMHAEMKTCDNLIELAKCLSIEERKKFREWIDKQPRTEPKKEDKPK